MRRRHFETLQPICPRCRAQRGEDVPLVLAAVLAGTDDDVREGFLHCSFPGCQLEYPIIDGLPILVANPRAYISDNLAYLTARRDLSSTMESLLGDCTGPGSAYDTTRLHLSNYAWDHYGDQDPQEQAQARAPGSVVRCLERGLELLSAPSIEGPVLDIGCSVGRTSFTLAERCEGLVLGVDLHCPMLQLAQQVLCEGVVRYPRRRVGVVYDRREFPVSFAGTERVDFWVADALALPFRDGTFGLGVALNVLDCVSSPLDFLTALRNLLQPGRSVLLTTPYDWSPGATPVEAWLGGHSQRGAGQGASEPILRSLLTPGAHPASVSGLELVGEVAEVDWQVRLHERGIMEYLVHLCLARRGDAAGAAGA